MSQRTVLVALVLGCLAVATLGLVVPATADTAPAGEPAVVQEVDPDDVLMSINVDADGNATWTIEYRTRLETDDDEAAFEEFREDVEADPDAYAGEFHDRMNATAADAEEATGREMAVTEMAIDVERRELPREYGVVTYTFNWSNFAAVDGDRLTIGDAIDGLFLDDASELRIEWPDGYGLVEANPSPDETRSGSVVWHGPTSFASGEPRVVADSTAETETPANGGDGDGGDGGDGGDTGSDGVLSTTTTALLIILLAAGAAAAYARRRGQNLPVVGTLGPTGDGGASVDTETPDDGMGDDGADDADGAASETPAGGGTSGATASTAADDDADVAEPEAGSGDADDGDADDGDADDDAAGGAAGDIDPELLSNEEQVLRLIRANGGRMKQKQVAEELDWTAAKTSQVTKGLREEGELEGFRLGRENVLALPEADPR